MFGLGGKNRYGTMLGEEATYSEYGMKLGFETARKDERALQPRESCAE